VANPFYLLPEYCTPPLGGPGVSQPFYAAQKNKEYHTVMSNWRGRGRRGPNANSRTARIVRSAIRQNEKRDNGHKFVPELVPPDFVTHPWNAFTYSVVYNGTGADIGVTTAQLVAYLRNKLGLAGDAQVPIRILKARVWCQTVGQLVQPNMITTFYELQASGPTSLQNARVETRDHGALGRPAKAGYTWPLQDRKEVISDTQDLFILNFRGPTSTVCTIMINFLYRTFDSAAVLQKTSDALDFTDPHDEGTDLI